MKYLICIALLLITVSQSEAKSSLSPSYLRCDYRVDPLGVDSISPSLSWILLSSDRSARGLRQTGYQIQMASTLYRLAIGRGDLWDSGHVVSGSTAQIAYQGKPLRSSQAVYWRVRVWDQTMTASSWSRTATWTTGIMNPGDWTAHWISSPEPEAADDATTLLIRREFIAPMHRKRALVHVCGLGQYELYINGKKVGADLLTPGWTNYRKTCLYDTYDVSDLIVPGHNAIGLFLAGGMYHVASGRYTKFTGSFGPLKAIAQIELDYPNNEVRHVGTDKDWRTAPGPVTFSSIYGGEDYDARREPVGWKTAGFDDSHWTAAMETAGPGGALTGLSAAAPPIRVYETLRAVRVNQISPAVAVYDLGQNASIMPRLVVQGPAGSVVRVTPAELLHADGTVDRGSCGGGEAYWQYTLDGSKQETYFPHFFYQGCRYLQVECRAAGAGEAGPPSGLPVVRSLDGLVVQASSTPVGDFSCSNDLFNRTYALIRWAQRSNMVSVMTDCPHREKLGWLEEDYLNGPALRYNFDMAPIMSKIVNDMSDSQRDSGLVPDIAPEYVVFSNGFLDSPEWGSAYLQVPWQQMEFDGDVGLLKRRYDGMQRYVDYLTSRSNGGIVDYGLGDWYDIGPNPPGYAQLTPKALTATAFYYSDTLALAKAAAILGKTSDADRYERQAAEIRTAYNSTFFRKDTGQYATGSQCGNAISLVMGLCEPENRASVLDGIVQDVRQKGLTAGDVGYRYLLRALADGERSDVIFAMNNQSDKPGYGYQLKMGATSLTEAWDARQSSSQNHFMLGQINEWFFHDLAGIQPDDRGPGFACIVIKPAIVGDIKWVKAHYDSLRGRIETRWHRDGQSLTLDVTIPPNTTATVYVPAAAAASVTENGAPAGHAAGVGYQRYTAGAAVYTIESGAYHFASKLAPIVAGE